MPTKTQRRRPLKLKLELVPASLHGINLRAALGKSRWDILRRSINPKRCAICEGTKRIEGHEVWQYPQVQERLNNVIQASARVIVGDASGVDKAVQKFLSEREYPRVTVFCSGDECRNNVGLWETRHIEAPKDAKGFDSTRQRTASWRAKPITAS